MAAAKMAAANINAAAVVRDYQVNPRLGEYKAEV